MDPDNIKNIFVSNKFIIKPSLTTSDYGKYVNIYAVNKTYSMLTPAFQYQYTYLPPGVVLQKELASFFGILLIPIMGIFSAYFYYSKDKMEGTNTHTRPTAVTEYILMPTVEAVTVE